MCRVLIVDDNQELAVNLAEILSAKGHEVRVAFDPAAAVDGCWSDACDLALIDMRLPDLDGVSLAHLLREAHPESNFMFMSGYSDDALLERAREFSGRPAFEKPLDLDAVLRQMQTHGCVPQG